jgi:TonB family protein
MSGCGNPLFSSIQAPDARTRWESFALSILLQTAALAALVVFSILSPRIAPPALVSHMKLIAPQLVAPPAAKAPVAPPVRPQQPLVRRVEAKVKAPSEIAKIAPPPVRRLHTPERVRRATPVAELPQPQMSAPKFESTVLASLPAPKSKIVAVNTFAGSSAAPTLKKAPVNTVQTGGFGDPNGVAAAEPARRQANIAAAGSFDLPQGAGHGNGTGGASGSRGTVASAGFGNGTAQPGGRSTTAKQVALQAASFSNAAEAAAPQAKKKAAPATVPVSIQSKPKPVYTPEARALKIEGEVLLKVVFTADGKVQVLDLVRGLGHGLDESAQKAAQGIRFTPATRDGKPVDSKATLHVVFKLS